MLGGNMPSVWRIRRVKGSYYLYHPVDFLIGKEVSDNTPTKLVAWQEIPDGWMGLDIGPASLKMAYRKI
jgi:3-phosphoglycerate kinase